MPHAKKIDRFDVTTLMTPGVPLSARTIKRRTGMKHRAVLAAVYEAVKEGRVRRVKTEEVGSNKYNEAEQRNDPRTPSLSAADEQSGGRKDKKKKIHTGRKFHVFVLA